MNDTNSTSAAPDGRAGSSPVFEASSTSMTNGPADMAGLKPPFLTSAPAPIGTPNGVDSEFGRTSVVNNQQPKATEATTGSYDGTAIYPGIDINRGPGINSGGYATRPVGISSGRVELRASGSLRTSVADHSISDRASAPTARRDATFVHDDSSLTPDRPNAFSPRGSQGMPSEGLLPGMPMIGGSAQTTSGRRADRKVVDWPMPLGVRPVIEPTDQVATTHDPGPGVIGIDLQ
jgi:hypothetical protein